jgi:hypothetical protein
VEYMKTLEVRLPVDLVDRLGARALSAHLPVESYISLLLWRVERDEDARNSDRNNRDRGQDRTDTYQGGWSVDRCCGSVPHCGNAAEQSPLPDNGTGGSVGGR